MTRASKGSKFAIRNPQFEILITAVMLLSVDGHGDGERSGDADR
jgi:hypothetical protein